MKGWLAAALAIGLAVAPATGSAPLAAQATRPRTPSHAEQQRRARRTGHAATPAGSRADESALASARSRLRTWANGALVLATRLERKQDHTPEHLRSDANALGRNIADAQRALSDLERLASPAEKQRLADVRSHLGEARTGYKQLAQAVPDSDLVATRAAGVRQHLAAAQTALGARPAPARSTARPAGRTGRRRTRKSRSPARARS